MTNHAPTFTSSSARGSFTELANTTGSNALHQLSGTFNFTDADHSDTHTTSVTLHSAVLSSGSVIPTASLADFNTAMTSQIVSDHSGSGQLKWSFSDPDDDFDFLSRDQTLVLTYNVVVSDNHGGTATQTVTVTVTGTDDKPVITVMPVATVTEQANQTLSLTPDTVHVAVAFTDPDLTNTGFTASVTAVAASGVTTGILPGALGSAELMAFFNVDNVVKASGSSSGTINTTFAAPDLAFDYLAAGEHLNITYTVQLDDHAGGVTTQNVMVTVIGTNDKPIYLSGPESAHLTEGQHLSSAGALTAQGDLLFSDVDLSDTHTVATTVTAVRSGGGSIPLSNAALLAAFTTSVNDSTGHLLGDVGWNFALQNNLANFLAAGETLTLTYHLAVTDPSHASDNQDVTITILGTNHPVVITSGPESASVTELANTTGSAAIDTTPTVPAGTLNFSDADLGDTHTVAVSLSSETVSGGSTVPAATLADLPTALTTTLHDSTGTGTGSIDWNFGLADKDFDFLAAGQTMTIDYTVKVSDASTSSTQVVAVTVTGANDPVMFTSGPQSGSVAELPGVTGSTAHDTTTPGTLNFTDPDLTDSHTVSVALDSAVWSANPDFVPAQTLSDLQTALLTTLHDSTGTGAGTLDWTFSIPDKDLDFLAAGETLTTTYDVTISDGLTSSVQTVTVTATGAEDPLVVNPATVAVADTALPDAGSTVAAGNAITDVSDSAGDASSTLSITAINGQPALVDTDIAGAHGTLFVDASGFYTYTANPALDQLQAGDNPTEQYNITVTNGLGQSEVTTLTFNFTGADDAPTITGGATFGSVTEDAGPSILVNGDFETGDLSGWTQTGSQVQALFLGLGGAFGNYAAELAAPGGIGSETLSQNVATTPGQHYIVGFSVTGDPDSGSNSFLATWDGTQILALSDVQSGAFTHYTFDVVGDPTAATTGLQFTYGDDGSAMFLDQVSVSPATSPLTETTSGNVSFADVETSDTHTASFTPLANGYVGTFSLDPVSESSGSGSVSWHYTVDNSAIQFLAQGQVLTQDYLVSVTDNHGATTVQDVTVTINGTNDAPTAVGENVITDVGPNGTVDIPSWALAANDTDPDTTDHLSVNSIQSSTGGTAVLSGDALFTDDATLGGSFTYNSTDGIAVSSNVATATVINTATSAAALTASSGDNILIANNGTEALTGGSGNDILIGNSGSHVMTGGGGNDTFAFLQPASGPNTITDFNNTTAQDHIALSATGFGGGLTAGMDVTPVFETSNDNQFSGFGPLLHFDTANQTLYFSSTGATAAEIAVVQLQPGVTLHPHDVLIV
jgi:VCBS repeat-containing protein